MQRCSIRLTGSTKIEYGYYSRLDLGPGRLRYRLLSWRPVVQHTLRTRRRGSCRWGVLLLSGFLVACYMPSSPRRFNCPHGQLHQLCRFVLGE
jgi:hypothetical protein